MKKGNATLVTVVSILVAFVLVLTVVSTILSVNRKITKYCFEELSTTSIKLAQELKNTIQFDHTMLSAMAEVMASREDLSERELISIMNSFHFQNTYLSYVAILQQDNVLMNQNGDKIDVSDQIAFSEVAKKGAYISEETESLFHPGDMEIYNVVPVVKEDQTVAVLYGVVSLSQFAELYTTDIYDGEAFVYLEDGKTGNFLLDTYHRTLGNIEEFRNRRTAAGYDFDTAIQDLQGGQAGNLCFISNATGKTIYLHYEPTGINNWNVLVSVDKDAAFRKTNAISGDLYRMAAIVGGMLLIYTVFMIVYLVKIYKTLHQLDTEDRITQLQNRSAYDAYVESTGKKLFNQISCIYVDANGLHEINNTYGHAIGDHMLYCVAQALLSEFPYKTVFRVGGDEFVVISEEHSQEECSQKMEHVLDKVEKAGYSVSVGIVSRTEELSTERVIREADKKMLQNKKAYYEKNNRREMRESVKESEI